jgi:nicotinamide mononucleotide adenylyltransferase
MSYREKRASDRIECHLDATVIADARVYDGSIKNLSENGLEYSLASPVRPSVNGNPNLTMRLIFSIFSDEVIRLDWMPRWDATDRSENHLLIGMKIITPPPRYSELIRNIHLCKYL